MVSAGEASTTLILIVISATCDQSWLSQTSVAGPWLVAHKLCLAGLGHLRLLVIHWQQNPIINLKIACRAGYHQQIHQWVGIFQIHT